MLFCLQLCLLSCTAQLCVTAAITWLGVGVVYSVAIQLEKLNRLSFLLSVAAHGEGVLTDLHQSQRELFSHQLTQKEIHLLQTLSTNTYSNYKTQGMMEDAWLASDES